MTHGMQTLETEGISQEPIWGINAAPGTWTLLVISQYTHDLATNH